MSPEEVREGNSKHRKAISGPLSEGNDSGNGNQEIPSGALKYPAEEIGGRVYAPDPDLSGRLMTESPS